MRTPGVERLPFADLQEVPVLARVQGDEQAAGLGLGGDGHPLERGKHTIARRGNGHEPGDGNELGGHRTPIQDGAAAGSSPFGYAICCSGRSPERDSNS